MEHTLKQAFGDALLSFLPTSAFFIGALAVSRAIATVDPVGQTDSRMAMVYLAILPLFFLGLVFGSRACWTIFRLYRKASEAFTSPNILGLGGLLAPFFLGLLWMAKFIIQLVLS